MYNYPNQYFFLKVCGMIPESVCDFTGICTSKSYELIEKDDFKSNKTC